MWLKQNINMVSAPCTPCNIRVTCSQTAILYFEKKCLLKNAPYEIGSPAAVLQNGFKKHCKRAVKWVAAAVPNFGCLNAVMGSGLPAIKSALAATQKR